MRLSFSFVSRLALLGPGLLGCNGLFGVDGLSYDGATPSGSGGATTGATMSVTTAAGGMMSTSSTTGAGGAGGGATGSGGAPVCVPDGASTCLVSDGLVVRYHLGEAVAGTGPRHALDAAADPLDLPLSYDDGLTYASVGGNRALSWPAHYTAGMATAPVAGTKVETALQGATAATLEVVALASVVGQLGARLAFLGVGDTAAELRLSVSSASTISMRFNGFPYVTSAAVTTQRHVYHAVIDTTRAEENERMLLYVDGVLANVLGSAMPALDETLQIDASSNLTLGNDPEMANRSMEGNLYYVAYYDRALSPTEVVHNVARLQADDDTPWP